MSDQTYWDEFIALGRAGANGDLAHPGRERWEELREHFKPKDAVPHDPVKRTYRIMSDSTWACYGDFRAESPEDALTLWAKQHGHGTWEDARQAGLVKGFHFIEGTPTRIYI